MPNNTAEILLRLSAEQVGSSDYGGPIFDLDLEFRSQLTTGVAAGQYDILWADERSLAASGTDDIDLAGVLASAFGATITMAEVVGLCIVNKPKNSTVPNVGSLTVGGGTNPFLGFLTGTTPTIRNIGPGGCLFLFSPDGTGLGAVTAATADILRIAASAAGSVTYQIAIIARTA